MNKTNLKVYVILLVIFGIMGFCAFLISDKLKNEVENLNAYLVIDCNRVFKYDNNNWTNVGSMKDIAMDKFKIYSNNNYIGDYYVSEGNDKYYFFDDDYNSKSVESPFIAISVNSTVSLIDYKIGEFDNDDYDNINSYFKKINISYDGDYSIMEKYIADLNNDSKDDYIYILSNQLYSDKLFYIIFAKVGNKYITIDNQLDSDDIVNYSLGWILNISENGLNDIILREFNNETYDYYLYRSVKKGEYTKILPE